MEFAAVPPHYRGSGDVCLLWELRASGTAGTSWGRMLGIQSIECNIGDRLALQP